MESRTSGRERRQVFEFKGFRASAFENKGLIIVFYSLFLIDNYNDNDITITDVSQTEVIFHSKIAHVHNNL